MKSTLVGKPLRCEFSTVLGSSPSHPDSFTTCWRRNRPRRWSRTSRRRRSSSSRGWRGWTRAGTRPERSGPSGCSCPAAGLELGHSCCSRVCCCCCRCPRTPSRRRSVSGGSEPLPVSFRSGRVGSMTSFPAEVAFRRVALPPRWVAEFWKGNRLSIHRGQVLERLSCNQQVRLVAFKIVVQTISSWVQQKKLESANC